MTGNKLKERQKAIISNNAASFISAITVIVFGMLVGLILLFIVAPNQPLKVIKTLLTGGFLLTGVRKGLGRILYYSAPLILSGLSVSASFKTGVFNMGISGQFQTGGLTAIIIGITCEPIFGPATWLVALVAGGIAGALWALLPAFLDIYRNVNVIISGIMMNYLGVLLMNGIIKQIPSVYDHARSWTRLVPEAAIIPKFGLDRLFPGTAANIGFLIVLLCAVGINFIFKKTTLGYEMKICGLNSEVARYAGISVTRSKVVSMLISGGLAGLGGAMYLISAAGNRYILSDAVMPQGFTGISIALLAMLNPIGIIFAGMFISFLQVGAMNVETFGIEPEIVDVITAVIIFCCAFAFILKRFYKQIADRLTGEKE